MKVHMSVHAQIRASERGIEFDKIKKVIANPSSCEEQFDGRCKVRKEIENRVITVIYKKEKGKFVIITAI